MALRRAQSMHCRLFVQLREDLLQQGRRGDARADRAVKTKTANAVAYVRVSTQGHAKEAAALAERMRPVMAQLAGLSAHKAAAELNRRKIASATGGKWYAATVIKLRDRPEA